MPTQGKSEQYFRQKLYVGHIRENAKVEGSPAGGPFGGYLALRPNHIKKTAKHPDYFLDLYPRATGESDNFLHKRRRVEIGALWLQEGKFGEHFWGTIQCSIRLTPPRTKSPTAPDFITELLFSRKWKKKGG